MPYRFFAFLRHDELVSALVVAGFEAARGLAPGCHRMTAAAWFYLRRRRAGDRPDSSNATIVRHFSHPAFAAGFAKAYIFVLDVADLSDGRGAFHQHLRISPDGSFNCAYSPSFETS